MIERLAARAWLVRGHDPPARARTRPLADHDPGPRPARRARRPGPIPTPPSRRPAKDLGRPRIAPRPVSPPRRRARRATAARRGRARRDRRPLPRPTGHRHPRHQRMGLAVGAPVRRPRGHDRLRRRPRGTHRGRRRRPRPAGPRGARRRRRPGARPQRRLRPHRLAAEPARRGRLRPRAAPPPLSGHRMSEPTLILVLAVLGVLALLRRSRRRRHSARYELYLRSPLWRLRRRLWIIRAGGRCQDCRRWRRPLTIHHLTYRRLGHERRSDVHVLCWPCHHNRHHYKRIRTR